MSTLLVVDDTESTRLAFARLLRAEGYDVVTAGSGKDAFRRLETVRPDMILLDVIMPEMDGMEFLELLRSYPAWRELPVIMISALSDPRRIRRAKELGARDFLIKAGLPIPELIRLINADVHICTPGSGEPVHAHL
jgi:CheY-like chemotaxis protein